MTLLFEHPLNHPSDLGIHAERAQVVTWQGREALHLENGLVLIPNRQLTDASIQVQIGVAQSAYPGIAFRVADTLNYELAYAVPHVTGQWDALQYDPVFHGSNTWQIYHDLGYQHTAQIPTGRWFQLKADFCGTRATVSVDEQPPLVVERLAHSSTTGLFGLWTFRPAYFCDLRVSTCDEQNIPSGEMPALAEGIVKDWFVEKYGVVTSEPNGIVNLNRYLPITLGEARLTRRFELTRESVVKFEFGFSDALSLELDGNVIFAGEKLFKGFANRATRGFAELDQSTEQVVTAGEHRITAVLRAAEFFGWGWTFAANTPGLHWLPAELG